MHGDGERGERERGEGERGERERGEGEREEARRLEAEQRLRLFPGCEGVRVVRGQGQWQAVMTASGDVAEQDTLVGRPSLALLVAFFERHGGYGREA